MAVEDVDRCDRTGWADVGRVGQLICGHQGTHRAQVGASDQGEPRGLEHTVKLAECLGHLVGIEVLDVVGGKHRIHRGASYRRHVGDGADQIGLNVGIDIEPHFLPGQPGEWGGFSPLAPATNMEERAVLRQLMARQRRGSSDNLLSLLQALKERALNTSCPHWVTCRG